MADWYAGALDGWLDELESSHELPVYASPPGRTTGNMSMPLAPGLYSRLESFKELSGHTWSDLGFTVLAWAMGRDGVGEACLREHGRKPMASIPLDPTCNHMVRTCVVLGLSDSLSALVESALTGWLRHRTQMGVFGPLYPIAPPQDPSEHINVVCRADLYERVRLWADHDGVHIRNVMTRSVVHFLMHELDDEQRELLRRLEGFGR
jgi:hypothetical protein